MNGQTVGGLTVYCVDACEVMLFCGNTMCIHVLDWYISLLITRFGRVVAEQIRPLNSSSGVSDQQSVGLNPGRDTCVLEQDTLP